MCVYVSCVVGGFSFAQVSPLSHLQFAGFGNRLIGNRYGMPYDPGMSTTKRVQRWGQVTGFLLVLVRLVFVFVFTSCSCFCVVSSSFFFFFLLLLLLLLILVGNRIMESTAWVLYHRNRSCLGKQIMLPVLLSKEVGQSLCRLPSSLIGVVSATEFNSQPFLLPVVYVSRNSGALIRKFIFWVLSCAPPLA
jgi:hypothetical protein